MFAKATRKQTHLKVALTGPSGSGKTWSALELCKGMGGRTALIDTENRSASLYAGRFEFDVAEIEPPYTVKKYEDAVKDAIAAGYDNLIIDSISHVWAGEGGLLDKKAALDQRGGNSFTNWGQITPEHNEFRDMILRSPVHMVCTMRSKTEYVVEQEGGKKATPRKVGMAPIQRDGMEYEFTVVFDLDQTHIAAVGKDRTALFDGQTFKITQETGKKLIAWRDGAEPTPAQESPPVDRVEAPNVYSDEEFEGLVSNAELAFEHDGGDEWLEHNASTIREFCTEDQKAELRKLITKLRASPTGAGAPDAKPGPPTGDPDSAPKGPPGRRTKAYTELRADMERAFAEGDPKVWLEENKQKVDGLKSEESLHLMGLFDELSTKVA